MNWPVVDNDVLKMSKTTVIVQINGKKRTILELPPNISDDALYTSILEHDRVKYFLKDRPVHKILKLPAKIPASLLLNILTGERVETEIASKT